MNFRQKNPLFLKMQGVQYLEADKALLTEKDPTSKALTKHKTNKERSQKEILWALLDIAEATEIRHNRRGNMLIDEVKTVIAENITAIKAAQNEEAAKELFNKTSQLIEKLPETEREALILQATEALPTVKKIDTPETITATDALKTLDFSQPKEIKIELIDHLVKTLELEVKGKKKEHKLEALKNYRDASAPTIEQSNNKTIEQPANTSPDEGSEGDVKKK